MAKPNLPSPTKVSGKFNAIYEAYYRQLDPKNLGTIEATVAAKFLKKSGLSDVVLSRIWDHSDPTGRGYLDRDGLFVALKLVALAQAGQNISMDNILLEPTNPPKVGEIPKIQPPKIQTVLPHTQDWSIAPADRLKYEALFESLQPSDGLLPGNKVRSVLMDSKLPLDALSRIWDLADQDKDGSLDRHEFLVAMHLVYQALDKKTMPASLPVELQRPKVSAAAAAAAPDNGFVAHFPSDIAPPPAVPALPAVVPPLIPPMPVRPAVGPTSFVAPLVPTSDLLAGLSAAAPAAVVDWVVSAADKQRFDVMFRRSDLDNDGLVSGMEIKDVFLQSGIPQLCLAQIWSLCDTDQSGKLTAEQFALAMWMVERKRMGHEPPECLAPNMVPPGQRGAAGDLVGLEAGGVGAALPAATAAFDNPELAMIAKEIEELVRERRLLESEVTQREADIRIKNGEVRSLQSELDTLAATLKQLENQKGEAQKRLDDLKAQTIVYVRDRELIVEELYLANEQVNKIREKCQKQEDTIVEMEGELDSKRSELQKLKDEETSLEREYDNNKEELDKVSHSLQETKLQISQIKSMVTQLQESQRQMSDALAICKSAIDTNNPNIVSDYTLKLEPEFREVKRALEKKAEKKSESPVADEYKSNGFTSNADPFGSAAKAGFATDFSTPSRGAGFDDSFGDSFGASAAAAADPFGDKTAAQRAITPDPNKDDFGSDPFAILHAPTSASQVTSPGGHLKASSGGPPPRPESPSPALPPKKAKQPPPRPAPPRPSMGPTPTRPEPPASGFGASSGGEFANFANFDDIISTPTQPLQQQAPPVPTPPSTNSSTPTPTYFPSAAASKTPTSTPTLIIPSKPKATKVAPTTTAAKAPVTDFADDPFKDYRYEDPFSIKDPFDDDADDTILSETFSSIIAVAPSPVPSTTSNSNNNTGSVGALTKSQTPVSHATSTSPAFAQFNNNSTSKFDAFSSPAQNPPANAGDFFDAFHDNFSKPNSNNNVVAAAALTANAKPAAIFADDPFASIGPETNSNAVYDPFGGPPTTSAKVDNAFAANFNNNATDFFANGFEDAFAKAKPSNGANVNKSSNDFAKFDAFNDVSAATNGNSKSSAFSTDTFSDDDDGFGAAAAFPSQAKPKQTNGEKGTEKKNSRYAADYSQGADAFDKDLQAALQRSMIDQ